MSVAAIVEAQQLPPVFGDEYVGKSFNDSRTRVYLTPQRIVWKYDGSDGQLIQNAGVLLEKGNGQSELTNRRTCKMHSSKD